MPKQTCFGKLKENIKQTNKIKWIIIKIITNGNIQPTNLILITYQFFPHRQNLIRPQLLHDDSTKKKNFDTLLTKEFNHEIQG